MPATTSIDDRLDQIAKQPFRAKFHLRGRERAFVQLRGINTVRRHGFDLSIDWRLSHGFLLRARQGDTDDLRLAVVEAVGLGIEGDELGGAQFFQRGTLGYQRGTLGYQRSPDYWNCP